MAIGDPYVTLAEFKRRARVTKADTDSDITEALEAASDEINRWCGQQFNRTADPAVRYLSPRDGRVIDGQQIVSVSAFATDEGDRLYGVAWDPATELDLWPFNAADDRKPYTEIRLSPATSHGWSLADRAVKVTGVFGWPAVPAPIKQACFLQAHRLFKRWDAPFGVIGSAELGTQMVIGRDNDILALVRGYRIRTV